MNQCSASYHILQRPRKDGGEDQRVVQPRRRTGEHGGQRHAHTPHLGRTAREGQARLAQPK